MDRVIRSAVAAGSPRVRWVAFVAAAVALVFAASVLAAAPARVATVVGKPVARQVFNHWMLIVAKGSAGRGPLIVPTDPPRFDRCIAQVRARIPSLRHTPATMLRRDCGQLFTALKGEALDLLIRTDWLEVEAAHDGIVVTDAQVEHAFAAGRRQMFPKPGQFGRFLRRTGQTVADIKFRVRGSLMAAAVRKAEHLSENALEGELTRRFRSQTTCARYYVMPDCAGG